LAVCFLAAAGLPRATARAWGGADPAGRLASSGTPGAVLVLVKGGQVILARGYADLEGRWPMEADRTVLRVASFSKPVVAWVRGWAGFWAGCTIRRLPSGARVRLVSG